MPHEEFENPPVTISWAFDSSIHHDDQLTTFYEIKGCPFVFLADGVSNSDCGRLAAVLIIHYFIEFLKERKNEIEKNISTDKLEKIFEDILSQASRRLVNTINRFSEYLRWEKISSDYEKLIAFHKKIENAITAFTQQFSIYRKLTEKMLNLCDKEKIIKLNQEHLQQIWNVGKKIIEYRKKLDQSLNVLDAYVQDLKSMQLNEFYIKTYQEPLLKILNSLKSYYLNFLSNKDTTPILEIHLPELDQPQKIFHLSNIPEIKATWKEVKNIIERYIGKNESFEDIKRCLDRVQIRTQIDSKTTLVIAAIFNANSTDSSTNIVTKVTLLILGDSIALLLNPFGDDHTEIYKKPIGKIVNYVSTKNGINGQCHIMSIQLKPNYFLILSTDGANVFYSTPAGVPGVIFTRKLKEHLSKYKSIKEFPESWLEFLRKKGALTDDASIVIISIKQNKQTND